jgi:hypothetical protein
MADARVSPAAAAHARQLKRYWATGDGAAKWATWTELRRLLAKYVQNPHELDGLTRNVYVMRYGHEPPHGGGGKGKGSKRH